MRIKKLSKLKYGDQRKNSRRFRQQDKHVPQVRGLRVDGVLGTVGVYHGYS